MKTLLFYSLFIAVMGALNLYVYRRLFRRLSFDLSFLAAALLWGLFAMEVLFVFEARTHLFMESPALFYLLSSAVGVTVILFFSALLYDLLHLLASRFPLGTQRRRRVKIAFDGSMLLFAVFYLGAGLYGGIAPPSTVRVDVAVGGRGTGHFDIVQLSDMHVGRLLDANFTRRCAERVNALSPDVVVITGDLVDMPVELLRDALLPLKEIKSRYGTYMVLGNHEYFHGVDALLKLLPELNIVPLLNESRVVGDAGAALNLVGINDVVSKRFDAHPYDVEGAFAGADPQLPTILLAHQPKALELVRNAKFDLMLSGHTHGGQIFPFGYVVMIDQPYLNGLHRLDGERQIYVSRGTGFWGPPVRVLAPGEITLLRVHPAAESSEVAAGVR